MHWFQSCILDFILLSLVVSVIRYIYVYLHVKWALKMAGPSLMCSVQMQHSPLYCDLLNILIEVVGEWRSLKMIYDCRGVFFFFSGTHLRLFHVDHIRIKKDTLLAVWPQTPWLSWHSVFAPKAGLPTVCMKFAPLKYNISYDRSSILWPWSWGKCVKI